MNALVFSIIGGITGIAGMIIGIAGIINNRFLAVHNYFLTMEDPEFVAVRSAVYNCKDSMDLNNNDIAIVINFFNIGGCLLKSIICLYGYLTAALVLELLDYTNSAVAI